MAVIIPMQIADLLSPGAEGLCQSLGWVSILSIRDVVVLTILRQ